MILQCADANYEDKYDVCDLVSHIAKFMMGDNILKDKITVCFKDYETDEKGFTVYGSCTDLQEMNCYAVHVNEPSLFENRMNSIREIRTDIGINSQIHININYDFFKTAEWSMIVRTIIHELTHAMQMFCARLVSIPYYWFEATELGMKRCRGFVTMWKTKEHGFHFITDEQVLSHQEYLDLPWEVHARRAEEKLLPLALRYLRHFDKWNDRITRDDIIALEVTA